jgi:hypothetical protein
MSLALLSLVLWTSRLPVGAIDSRPADATSISKNPLYARLRLDLFDRTYPDFVSRVQRYDGPILYPGYIDLSGLVSVEGPGDTLKAISEQLNSAAGQPSNPDRRITVMVSYRGSRPAVTADPAMRVIPVSLKAITISAVPGEFRWRFAVPVSDRALWKDGLYQIEATVSYQLAGQQAVLATKSLPFEIITLHKGSGDEINLYTNAALNQPDGFGLRLFKLDPEFRGMKPYQRILTLDSGDVFARKIIARAALYDTHPETALEMYRQILADLEAGKAKRIECLMDPRHSTPRDLALPKEKQQWLQVVKGEVATAESAVRYVEAARAEVTSAIDEKGAAALETLLHSNSSWVQLLAVREAKKRVLTAARGPLLKAILGPSRDLQREIVNALVVIEGSGESITLDTLPEDQERIIRSWVSTAAQEQSTTRESRRSELKTAPGNESSTQPSASRPAP